MEITATEAERRLNHRDNLALSRDVSPAPPSAAQPWPVAEKDAADTSREGSSSSDVAADASAGAGPDETVSRISSEELPCSVEMMDVSSALDAVLKDSRPRKKHNHVGQEAKEVMGTLAHFQSQASVAQLFDVTPPVVSMTERGLKGGTSLDEQKPNPELKEVIKSKVDEIIDLTQNVAIRAARKISDEKLDKLGAVELARVTKDMASVGGALNPKTGPAMSQVVVIAHPRRELTSYEVVDVRAREIP